MVLFVDYLHYLNLVSVPGLLKSVGLAVQLFVGSSPVPKLSYIYTPAARVAILLGVRIDGVGRH